MTITCPMGLRINKVLTFGKRTTKRSQHLKYLLIREVIAGYSAALFASFSQTFMAPCSRFAQA